MIPPKVISIIALVGSFVDEESAGGLTGLALGKLPVETDGLVGEVGEPITLVEFPVRAESY
jgi:hypothetical protein